MTHLPRSRSEILACSSGDGCVGGEEASQGLVRARGWEGRLAEEGGIGVKFLFPSLFLSKLGR